MTSLVIRQSVFWLLVALGLMGTWLALQFILMPIQTETSRLNAAQTSLADLKARREAVAAALAGLRDENGATADNRLDTQGSVEDALQRFQERVRDALATAGGMSIVSQSGSQSLSPGLTTLRVLLKAQLTEPRLMSFLKEIESGAPKVMIAALEMHPEAGNQSGEIALTVTLQMLHADAP